MLPIMLGCAFSILCHLTYFLKLIIWLCDHVKLLPIGIRTGLMNVLFVWHRKKKERKGMKFDDFNAFWTYMILQWGKSKTKIYEPCVQISVENIEGLDRQNNICMWSDMMWIISKLRRCALFARQAISAYVLHCLTTQHHKVTMKQKK